MRNSGASGGGLVHSGELVRLLNTSFIKNQASTEGPAVQSLGAISDMAGGYFEDNILHCDSGFYLKVGQSLSEKEFSSRRRFRLEGVFLC